MSVEPSAGTWRRVSFLRTLVVLGAPALVLSAISGALWLGVHFSTPETFERIHFWFWYFDVGREYNVPTWYSTLLWALAGVTALWLGRLGRRLRLSWAFLGAVCLVFSIDEFLELHERLDAVGNQLRESLPFDVHFSWVIPGVLIAAGIALLLLRLVLAMEPSVRWRVLAAGVLFVGGGFVFETLAGQSAGSLGMTWRFFLLTLIEETLEMLGVAMFVAALLSGVQLRTDAEGVSYRERALVRSRPAEATATPARSAELAESADVR